MAVDRLGELRRHQVEVRQEESAMEREVAPIHKKLEALRELTAQLEQNQADYLSSGDKKAQARIDATIADLNITGTETKNMITALNERTKHLAAKGASETDLRIRQHVFTSLSKKLIEVTRGAWDMQNEHQMDLKNQVARRLKIRYTNPDGSSGMSDEDAQRLAQKLVQTGNQDQIFLLARDELERAMETRDAVAEIERSMRELHQMFCDLNLLIQDQGEGMDVVQSTVQTAADRVEAGNNDLRLARKYQSKTCCAAM